MSFWPRFGLDFHAHPLVLVKLALSRVMTLVEFCHRCGARCRHTWWAAPALWAAVMGTGDAGVRCLDCFDVECAERGIVLRWVPRVDAHRDARGQWLLAPPDPELFPTACLHAEGRQ